jgi:hypothetical protein
MISESNFANLESLRRAAHTGDLGLMAGKLAATGEAVAIVAALQREADGSGTFYPFGILTADTDMVSADGRLMPYAKSERNKLEALLTDKKQHAWFDEVDGRVSVRFSKVGEDAPAVNSSGATLVLAWGNPFELFEPPM